MRIAFVTTGLESIKDEDIDRPLHERTFAAAGIGLDYVLWHDPTVEWARYDLVVLRSPWDYSERLEEFLQWLDRAERETRVENPPAVVRWNLDKHYLRDLQSLGVPVVPTEYLECATEAQSMLARRGDDEVVIKPAVSAGSRNTGRFVARDPAAMQLVRKILAEEQSVMLQPSIQSVAREGEVSLLLFDGELSHAIRKGPVLAPGGGFLGGSYSEEISPVEASQEQIAVATSAARATRTFCRDHFGVDEPLLYARYDVVRLDDGREVLLEAELFEPSLFIETVKGSAERFIAAVASRAERPATGR